MHTLQLRTAHYHLDSTLDSGQAFRWRRSGDGSWVGAISHRWVQLRSLPQGIEASTPHPPDDWNWLHHYLQSQIELDSILNSFPTDDALSQSIESCRGLRLLRQDPWETLASFILSSTKQIVQIKQIVELLCQRWGTPLSVPAGHPALHAFPTAPRIASLSETELRDCKMGFRAPHLLNAARRIDSGELQLHTLQNLPLDDAREMLCQLRGVGPKIADCVLLFAYDFPAAFPIDVWVQKALRELYFKGRRVKPTRLESFARKYFGPQAGYAQQYLFHYMRTRPPIRTATPLQKPTPKTSRRMKSIG